MLVLTLIIIRELAKVSWVIIIPELTSSPNLFFSYFFTLQLFFAIIQGSLSDHFCRRKSLIIAFCAISIGQFFLFGALKWEWLLWVGLGIDGCLGNVPPIGRAALIDINFLNNPKKALGWSFVVLAPPWILAILIPKFPPYFLITGVFLLTILGLILTVFRFQDKRDLDPHGHLTNLQRGLESKLGFKKIPLIFIWLLKFFRKEFKAVLSAFLVKACLLAYVSFILAQSAFEIIFYYLDFVSIREEEGIIIVIMLASFMLGSLTQVLIKYKQGRIVLIGYILSALSIPFGYLMKFIHLSPEIMKIVLFGPITYAAGFYIPAIYTFVSMRYKTHDRGKVLGILDSIQTLGDMIGAFVLVVWRQSGFFIEELPSFFLFILAFYFFFRLTTHLGKKKEKN